MKGITRKDLKEKEKEEKEEKSESGNGSEWNEKERKDKGNRWVSEGMEVREEIKIVEWGKN